MAVAVFVAMGLSASSANVRWIGNDGNWTDVANYGFSWRTYPGRVSVAAEGSVYWLIF
jgi:hypothetical protein